MTPDAMAVVATLVVGFVALFWQGRDKLSPRFDALDERLRHVEQGIVELRTLLAERLPRRVRARSLRRRTTRTADELLEGWLGRRGVLQPRSAAGNAG